MAKTSRNKEKSDNQTTEQQSPISQTGLVDPGVDRIRDILFGGHIEQYEKQFQILKAELDSSYEKLKSSLEKRTDELEKLLISNADDLSNRIDQEAQTRDSKDQDLATNLEKTATDLTERLNQIDGAKTDRELLASLLRGLADQLEKSSK